ncbi:MAG: large-conductance mechanosensitive channel protein MscL [Bacteroidota bacterium]
MNMFKDFKKFALRGNVVDMAVGIIIGAAFGKIVTSMVTNIIMPPIGWILTGIDVSDLMITIKKATKTTEAVTINYGLFLNTVLDFFIISGVIFIVVKQLNKLKKKEVTKPAATPEEVLLLREIRDSLKK